MNKRRIRIFLRWGSRKIIKRPGIWYTCTKSLNEMKIYLNIIIV